jgi:integrase
MPSPVKHSKTGTYYLRQRVPVDLKEKAQGKSVALPVDKALKSVTIGEGVKVSLATKDPAEAKARYREADAALSKFWGALRNGPIRLTQKEVAERAGLVYGFFADTFEEDAEDPEFWARSQRIDKVVLWRAKLGERPCYPLTTHQRKTLEPRFGPFIDQVLFNTGEEIDAESRDKLLVAVAFALQNAQATILRRAYGDYGPDTEIRQRYPEYTPSEEPKADREATHKSAGKGAELDLFMLLDHKFKHKGTAKTYRAYLGDLKLFVEFIGHSDAERVTKDNVREWKDALIKQGLSAKTINDKKLSAVKATIAHGVNEFSLTQNVAVSIRDKRDAPVPIGSRSYTHEQATAILQGTFKGTEKGLDPHHQRAVFWVPWICAYTGLRVSEAAQIQGKNVRIENGHPIFFIDPADGGTKSKAAWTTGIHEHLVNMGILEMFKSVGDGPAFYRAYPEGTDMRGMEETHRAKYSGSRVGDWTQSVLTEPAPGGRPNHAWRHLFTTLSRRFKMTKENRDYMLGSRKKADAREGYGDFTPDVVCGEINKLPRFGVKDTGYRPTLEVLEPEPVKDRPEKPRKTKEGKLILVPPRR